MIVCWALALIALFIGLMILRTYLADYERVQPKYVAEEIFEGHFVTPDYDALMELSTNNNAKFDSKEKVAEYLTSLTNGKELSYHNVSTGVDTDSSKYIVKYEEDGQEIKVASFTLKKTDQKSEKGFALYELAETELFYPAPVSVKIIAQDGFVPYVNGIALDDSYITEPVIESEANGHLPDGVHGIFYRKYEVSGLIEMPDVKIKSVDGTEQPAVLGTESGCYEIGLTYDAELEAEFSDYVKEAAEMYATHMQNDCTFGKVAPYFEEGTTLYNDIRTAQTLWVIDHDSYSFEDESVSEFYRYDENTFSCRVKLTHILKRSRLEDFRDYMDVTFYLRNVDGKYLIYDRTNN